MPIKIAVKNKSDNDIVVYRYFGIVEPEQVVAALTGAFAKLTPELPYRSLMIFEGDVDLSELTANVLETLRDFGEKSYRQNHLGPPAPAPPC